jgi:hypothetical protein
VDLIRSDIRYWYHDVALIPSLWGIKRLEVPAQEAIAVDALTLEQYHEICYWDLSQRRHVCSTAATVTLNAIMVCPSGDQLEDSIEIAFSPDGEVYQGNWETTRGAYREVVEGGWTRYYNFILAAW